MRSFGSLILAGMLAGTKVVATGVVVMTLVGPLYSEERAAIRSSGLRGTPEDQPASPIARLRSTWKESMAQINRMEGVQMVTAVLAGSQMGPGDGWFHPGQSRYGWKWLVQRYDQDGDEKSQSRRILGPGRIVRTPRPRP